MIGSGLKKLAVENGMKVAHGVAYGSLRGFAATMSEGSGYKLIQFSTAFVDPVQERAFSEKVRSVDIKKEFRVTNLEIGSKILTVVFHDTVGTMKKIQAFLDWFLPMLEEFGANKATVCPQCGLEISDGKWMLINGCAHYFHPACAEKVRRDMEAEKEQEKQERTGSYGLGAVGAFLGAALGAVVWALVLVLGYVASIVGLLIGWLAEKGYELLRGRKGWGKVVILIFAVIFGVAVGTIGAYVVVLAQMIGAGELPGLAYGDIPAMLFMMVTQDAEFLAAVVKDSLMGLFFAGLGVYGILARAGKETAGAKLMDLE